jgi:thiamine biosynthesis lipoprotein
MKMPMLRAGFRAMAADNEIQVFARDRAMARAAVDAAIADVQRIEAKYSRYRDDSVTTRINRAAGDAAVPIDAETRALLDYAQRCHELSGGLFDITSGVLRRAWDFRKEPPQLPDAKTLVAARALIGWTGVERDESSVRLPRRGMEIDFGGIGKEYAADRAATILQDAGVTHGLVNLAGDVRALGTQPDGAPWRVGIQHPRREGGVIACVELAGGAVATSGDYERYFDLDGRRYCHILNPRTGMPAAHWQSVSVVAPLCVVAGSCATIAMLLEAQGEAFLAAQGVHYIAVGPDGTRAGDAAKAPAR